MKAIISKKGHGLRHMILAHGFLGLPSEWDFLIENLKDKYTFHLLTLPGHQEAPIDSNIEEFFESLAEYATAFKSFSLLGYSMGGRLLLEFALRNLSSIEALILESANPGIRDQNEREARYNKDLLGFQERSFADFLNDWYLQCLFNPKLNYHVSEKLMEHELHRLERAMAVFSPGLRPSLWNELKRLKNISCHFISGAQDHKYFNIGNELKSIGWKHHTLDSYHNVHLERPIEYLELIKKLEQS